MSHSGENGGSGGDIETELSRDMSLFDITFIGVGAMIGAGVFALTGDAAGLAGPALTLSFLLNGFVAMFTAVSYAELGAAFPEAGGGYLWVKEALVDPNGFYAGWMSWFAHAVACSLYAITFGVFLLHLVALGLGFPMEFHLFGVIDAHLVEKILAALMVGLFAYINYRGAEETGKAGIIVTGIKVVILGLFIVFGIMATLKTPNWPAKFLSNPEFAPNGIFGILGAMGFTYIAFEGYEIIVQSGEEVVDPGKNIPKAVFYSMLIVVPIYVLVAFSAIGGIEVTQHLIDTSQHLSGTPESVFTWQLLGDMGELGIIEAAGQFVPYGAVLLLVAGLAATMSALNATIYSSSRVSFAMGRDRVLPDLFNKIHQNQRTPHWAILLSAVLIIVMAVLFPIEAVAASADIMFILLFIQVNWTVIKMRKTHPDLPRTYTIPYMPWPPLIGIALQFILMPFLIIQLGLTPGLGEQSHGFVALVTTAVWMALGLTIYYGYSEKRERAKLEEETPTVLTESAPTRRTNQVLVPIANPESVEQLLSTALDLAQANDAEVRVMSVVTVPQQTPLAEGRQFVDEHREILDRAIAFADEERPDVPVSGTIRIGHDVSTAILNTIEQEDTDLLLLGWRARSRRREIVLGSTVDPVVKNAHCDVLVERVGERNGIESILVPTAGGPHAEFAVQTANAIARATGATIELSMVVSPSASEEERASAQSILDRRAAEIDGEFETVLIESDDVSGTIIERSADHDLTVIGASRESLLQQIVFGGVPERVGREAEGTVIMAKQHLGLTSRIQRWLKRQNH